MSGMRKAFVGLGLAVGLVMCTLPGCAVPVDDTMIYPSSSEELSGASLSPEGLWESMPWSDPEHPWLRYPGRTTVQLEHGMGRVPRSVAVYLAFDSVGTEPGLASGDLARVSDVNENTVTIRNDTSASFFIRVVLQ